MKITPIEHQKTWEDFISRYCPAALFQSWSWGEANHKAYTKNTYVRLGIYNGLELIGIAGVETVRAKRGTFLHIRHGPIFVSWNEEYLKGLINYLRNDFQKKSVSFVRISPLIFPNVENKKLFNSLGFVPAAIHAMDAEYCWILDLNNKEEELLGQMRKTTRYLIRQGAKMGIVIKKSVKGSDLKEFFELYKKTASRHGFVAHSGIKEEFDVFSQYDQIMLFNGYYQNDLLASALILFYQNQGIYHHSASLPSKVPVVYSLLWEAILESKRRGKEVFNFWGIAPEGKPNHPWNGLTLFKKGFGGESVEYIHAMDLPLSAYYSVSRLIDLGRKIRKGY